MTHATCRLTAKNRDQLRNPTLGNRVWAICTFTAYRAVTEHNIDRGGSGRKETGMGTGEDGSQSVRERVRCIVRGAGKTPRTLCCCDIAMLVS